MKKKIAIVAGGDSSEVVVSLKSAKGLESFIDGNKYEKYIVTIVGKEWNVQLSETEKIAISQVGVSNIHYLRCCIRVAVWKVQSIRRIICCSIISCPS